MVELHETLQKVSGRDDLGAKFCFFIDGLDEYEGEPCRILLRDEESRELGALQTLCREQAVERLY